MHMEFVNRRPLKTRSRQWARRAAAALVRTSITPDQISMFSVFFALAGATLLLLSETPMTLLVCAACIQLRLACNLLDGMVALEGGKKSPVGDLYNEIPDRIADSLLLVAAGYHVGWPAIGWAAALLAAITAYIRVLGGSLGLQQDFRGPMAKPHRMAVLTAACLGGAAELQWHDTQFLMQSAIAVISLGSLITCGTRAFAMARVLRASRKVAP